MIAETQQAIALHDMRNLLCIACSHMPALDDLGSAIHVVECAMRGVLTKSGEDPMTKLDDVRDIMIEWMTHAMLVLGTYQNLEEKGVF